jgi:hypothetical protein
MAWNSYAQLLLSGSGFAVTPITMVLKTLNGSILSVDNNSIWHLDGIDGDDCLLAFAEELHE